MKRLVVILCMIVGSSLMWEFAYAQEHKAVVRLGVITTELDNKSRRKGTSSDIKIKDKTGGQINFEYKLSRNFGIGVSYSETKHDLRIPPPQTVPAGPSGNAQKVRTKYRPFTLVFNYHFARDDTSPDFYIGPSIGFARLSGTINSKRKSGLGVNAGVDFPLGEQKKFIISLGGNFSLTKYKFKQNSSRTIDYDVLDPDSPVLEIPRGTKFDIRPWSLFAGVGYRF